MELAKTHDYCKMEGPKLTVVMLHGIASDSGTYGHALEYLEKAETLESVRFVTFDLLGSGKSPKNEELNYDYNDQLEALHNSIEKLDVTTPLVLMGHSLGTFIVTRYANTYAGEVAELILISPPVYTKQDLENPAFAEGIKVFEQAVSAKDPAILQEKSFKNSMSNIVMDKENYEILAGLKVPATLIYGKDDQLIAAYNLPKLLEKNKNLRGIETDGKHGVTRDKYVEVGKVLERILHA